MEQSLQLSSGEGVSNISDKSECYPESTSQPTRKKAKINVDEEFSGLLGDIKKVISTATTTERQPSSSSSCYIKMIEEKLNMLPLRERNQMEINFLQLLNDKILELNENL